MDNFEKSKIAPVTMNEDFNRVFNLGSRMRYIDGTAFDMPIISPIQKGELVILSESKFHNLPAGVPLKVQDVEYTRCDYYSIGWEVTIYVSHKGYESGWSNSCARLHVRFNHSSGDHGFFVIQTNKDLGFMRPWRFKEVIEEWENGYKEGLGSDPRFKIDNPHEEGSFAHRGWAVGRKETVMEYEEENQIEDNDFDIDEEYERNREVMLDLSCCPEGLTSTEANDILYDR